jgi:transposase-like protein
MSSGGRRKRTNSESKVFKSKIIELRAQNESIVKIAKQMGVTRQYVSLVLNEAGLGGRSGLPEKKRIRLNDKMRPEKDDIDTNISRLEQRGDYTLASLLRVVSQRRKG